MLLKYCTDHHYHVHPTPRREKDIGGISLLSSTQFPLHLFPVNQLCILPVADFIMNEIFLSFKHLETNMYAPVYRLIAIQKNQSLHRPSINWTTLAVFLGVACRIFSS
eukprot:TRINITY_DN612_c0_g1_i5.p1 TRINITY_DN612_c0_g1~~TRINITY_DN612_c0_g1_i5.p1  ORF type:complete len:108 (-),score=9.45 TRINITY_DN612_c0_g1_i5:329-652(-)